MATLTDPVRVGVDVGGTFTDVVLLSGDRIITTKTPTTADQSVGVLSGIQNVCAEADIDLDAIDAFDHATTVSVNALLERDGAKTTLVTTEGFEDVLAIGRQDRPKLYDLSVERPEPLVPRRRRLPVAERTTVSPKTTSGGTPSIDPRSDEQSLTDDALAALTERVAATDPDAVAVCLLHAYADPTNEQAVVGQLRAALDVPISASHEVLPTFREYERTTTTVANAFVSPVVESYLDRLVERTTDAGIPRPTVMQANGGVAPVEAVTDRPITTVFSGPAAGVVGAAAAAADEMADLVTFDMGGTSADVSRVRGGDVERTADATIGGRPVAIPMVDVETVGSGGGSIAWIDDGGALQVGPESAGAQPGPACYGRGGTRPTVTDAQVVLGYIGSDATLGGSIDIDAEAATAALADLAAAGGFESPAAAAQGVYRVANAQMTRAVRSVTVEAGHDPRSFGLVAFGGAGPVHAAAIARELSIDRVLLPLAGGVLSAYGLLAADEVHDAQRTRRTALAECDPGAVEEAYEALREEARSKATDGAATERFADCRYAGQSFELRVSVDVPFDPAAVRQRFHDRHETVHGYRMDEPVELVTLRVDAVVERTAPSVPYDATGDAHRGTRDVTFVAGTYEADVYQRRALSAGTAISGPAVVTDRENTAVLPPDWSGNVANNGTLVLTRAAPEADDR